jgi:hypothetical protein
MKRHYYPLFMLVTALACGPTSAQESNSHPDAKPSGGYAADLGVVSDAQQQALAQARQLLTQGGTGGDRGPLATAVQEMTRAEADLAAAKNAPEKLPAAIAAEQAAYQDLLKATPREFRMRQSNSRNARQGSSAGQPDQRQFDQLDLTQEQNRYETERQAQAPANAQQREQTQVADRLKELSQRQQDLNDRLRELQSALQAARTDQQRQDLQDQLKRLEDEQRQMLANVDDLRQQLEQSPNAQAETSARQQLEQTRNDMQRASEAMQNQSPSQALAEGTRAQQGMQNLQDNLRKQTSSQFSDQMRQMRNEARDMMNRENEIARGLDSLQNGQNQSLDDSAQRRQLTDQLARQQSALTNLMAGMKDVTEQAETTEPLLSKQLYDTLRRADQMHTDNLLDMGSQLVDRGFLPQASEVERATRTNLTEIANSVTRAADSVLGSQADALRYAQRSLDDLSRQLERELGDTTNQTQSAAGGMARGGDSNQVARASGQENGGDESGPATNAMSRANQSAADAGSAQPEGNSPRQNGTAQRERSGQATDGSQSETAANRGAPQRGESGGAGGSPTDANAPDSPNARANGGQQPGGQVAQNQGGGANGNGQDALRQIAERLGNASRQPANSGPITGNDYANWAQQLRDVQSVLDSPDLRNQLATVSDRASALRAAYRNGRRLPPPETIREQLMLPLTQVQVWVREELARQDNSASLVPLDRDPVPDGYSDLVRKYYQQLGSAR